MDRKNKILVYTGIIIIVLTGLAINNIEWFMGDPLTKFKYINEKRKTKNVEVEDYKVVVEGIAGRAYYRKLETDRWKKLEVEHTLDRFDEVLTDEYTEIILRSGLSQTKIFPQTLLMIEDNPKYMIVENDTKLMLGYEKYYLSSGQIIAKVSKKRVKKNKEEKYEIRTPSTICRIGGTEMLVNVKNDNSTLVAVTRGIVNVETSTRDSLTLTESDFLKVDKKGHSSSKINPLLNDSLDTNSIEAKEKKMKYQLEGLEKLRIMEYEFGDYNREKYIDNSIINIRKELDRIAELKNNEKNLIAKKVQPEPMLKDEKKKSDIMLRLNYIEKKLENEY